MKDTYLILNLLTCRQGHFFDEGIAYPVQFHCLTPIIKSARNEHLVRIVRPAIPMQRTVQSAIQFSFFFFFTVRATGEGEYQVQFFPVHQIECWVAAQGKKAQSPSSAGYAGGEELTIGM